MENKNKSEYIYTKIKDLVLSGEIAAGEKINQVELANRLGVSRTPVVKSLYRLTSEGLIENIPNKGFYIINYTLNELVDLLKIRQAFDRVLAENLVEGITDIEINVMYAMFEPFLNCRWTENLITEYLDIDKDFHEYLIEICSNKWVEKIDSSFHIYGKVYRGGLIRPPQETLPEHLRIIKAIENQDFEAVVRELNEHIQTSIDVLEKTIKTLSDVGYQNKII